MKPTSGLGEKEPVGRASVMEPSPDGRRRYAAYLRTVIERVYLCPSVVDRTTK
jgi:hypothetical protein